MTPVMQELALAVSQSLAASIVVKVTVILALSLLGVFLARKRRAAVRHALLAAAFGVALMLPIVSVIAPPVGIKVPVAAQHRAETSPAVAELEPIASGAPAINRTAAVNATGLSISLFTLLLTGWMAGAAIFLLPTMVGLWKVRSLRRSGLPWPEGQLVVDDLAFDTGIHRRVEILLYESLPGPMTCGIVQPAILLPADARNWDRQELNRALVHELEHVRRCDWVSHCMARALCSAYWFNPLIWMAWRQLALEAERSCDDAVLNRSKATAYADQLVDLARRLSAKSPLLAMANRADLATRVSALLDSSQQRGRAGKFWVFFASAAAALFVLTLAPLRVVAQPQDSTAQAAPLQRFEAVSVKLVDPNVQGQHWHENGDAKRMDIIGSVHGFILRSYGITEAQLSGEPGWFNSRLYSILGVTLRPIEDENQRMAMFRSVLADRFQLKLREESRELPVFGLEVAPGGPKFHELKPGETPHHDPAPPNTYGRGFTSVEQLVKVLNGLYGGLNMSPDRRIIGRTGLTGKYDMYLLTEQEPRTDLESRLPVLPNLAQDMQSELGLKLIPERVSMPHFVVESASAPSPN